MTEIHAQKRNTAQKAGAYRNQNLVPGIAYGPGVTASAFAVPRKEIDSATARASESELIGISLEGKVLRGFVRDEQHDPVTGSLTHFDFYVPELSHEVVVKVPVHFVGKSPATEQGATIVKNLSEIKVEALPEKIPKEFVVDISVLAEPHQSILVKDIPVPSGVRILAPDNTPVVSATVQKEEKIESAPEAAAPEAEASAAADGGTTAPNATTDSTLKNDNR